MWDKLSGQPVSPQTIISHVRMSINGFDKPAGCLPKRGTSTDWRSTWTLNSLWKPKTHEDPPKGMPRSYWYQNKCQMNTNSLADPIRILSPRTLPCLWATCPTNWLMVSEDRLLHHLRDLRAWLKSRETCGRPSWDWTWFHSNCWPVKYDRCNTDDASAVEWFIRDLKLAQQDTTGD